MIKAIFNERGYTFLFYRQARQIQYNYQIQYNMGNNTNKYNISFDKVSEVSNQLIPRLVF